MLNVSCEKGDILSCVEVPAGQLPHFWKLFDWLHLNTFNPCSLHRNWSYQDKFASLMKKSLVSEQVVAGNIRFQWSWIQMREIGDWAKTGTNFLCKVKSRSCQSQPLYAEVSLILPLNCLLLRTKRDAFGFLKVPLDITYRARLRQFLVSKIFC